MIILVALAVFVYVLWRYFTYQEQEDEGAPPPVAQPAPVELVEKPLVQQPKTQKKYHARAADEPPDGQTKREIDYDHQAQREEIMKAQRDRGDLLEPASQRASATQGHGRGLPPHPLMASMPQGSAANLSTDASVNPEAQENADAHPENTPVPNLALRNQLQAQATHAPTPHKPGT